MIAHRSVLFVPAANARALEKAAGLPADALVLDLEDSAAADQKEDARARAAAFPGGQGARAVRVNRPGSAWFAGDIAAVAPLADCAIVLPKVSSADELRKARAALAAAGGRNLLWAMIETPLGLINLREIGAAAHETGLEALIAGPNDLSAALRLPPAVAGRAKRDGLLPHLAQIVLAARAFGLAAYDGVYNDFTDEKGLIEEARQGRALGFDGKTLIHPAQIATANEIFGPSADELDWARRVVAAFAAPAAQGRAAIRMGGEMLERMHLERAEAMLARAAAARVR